MRRIPLSNTIPEIKCPLPVEVPHDRAEIDFAASQEMVGLDSPVPKEQSGPPMPLHPRPMLPSRVDVIGNYLPRKCGIATFTADLCDAIHTEYEATELLAVPVNDPGTAREH